MKFPNMYIKWEYILGRDIFSCDNKNKNKNIPPKKQCNFMHFTHRRQLIHVTSFQCCVAYQANTIKYDIYKSINWHPLHRPYTYISLLSFGTSKINYNVHVTVRMFLCYLQWTFVWWDWHKQFKIEPVYLNKHQYIHNEKCISFQLYDVHIICIAVNAAAIHAISVHHRAYTMHKYTSQFWWYNSIIPFFCPPFYHRIHRSCSRFYFHNCIVIIVLLSVSMENAIATAISEQMNHHQHHFYHHGHSKHLNFNISI